MFWWEGAGETFTSPSGTSTTNRAQGKESVEGVQAQCALVGVIIGINKRLVGRTLLFVDQVIFVRCLSTTCLNIGKLFASILNVLGLTRLNVNATVVCDLCRPTTGGSRRQLTRLVGLCQLLCHVITIIILLINLTLVPFLNFFVGSDDNVRRLQLVCLVCITGSIYSCLLDCGGSVCLTCRGTCIHGL